MAGQEELLNRIASLQEEVAHLRQAIVSHAVVDQAIGVVIARGGLRPEAGWEILRDVSQQTNTKLRDIAEHVVQWPFCGWLPDEIRAPLETALDTSGTHGAPLT
ncbi:ANTAR domain-containing protein [Streptomyces sp. NPDC059785]|uniref:ANTAR domain-containing protein n=1 Tax=unclassified Streptomyces TaxID=2593676 RepID=UPI00364E5F31